MLSEAKHLVSLCNQQLRFFAAAQNDRFLVCFISLLEVQH